MKIDGVGLQEWRPVRPQQPLRPVCEQQSGRAAKKREQRALGQQLHDQASAACAKRQADRDFLLAHRRAREQKVGDVRTRNEQHEPDDGHQQAAGHHEVVAESRIHGRLRQWHDRHAAAAVLVRILLRELPGDRFQIRVGLLRGDARLQPAGGVEDQATPAVGSNEREEESIGRHRIRHIRDP